MTQCVPQELFTHWLVLSSDASIMSPFPGLNVSVLVELPSALYKGSTACEKEESEEFLAHEEESMKYDEFIEQVQKRARLTSPSEAQHATQATLEALAAYISPRERHDAASELPKTIKEYIQKPFLSPGDQLVAPPCKGKAAIEDFYQRVSLLEGVPLDTAREHARVVMSVLHDALSKGELQDIREDLPPELYSDLFVVT